MSLYYSFCCCICVVALFFDVRIQNTNILSIALFQEVKKNLFKRVSDKEAQIRQYAIIALSKLQVTPHTNQRPTTKTTPYQNS